ncbi:hypothetical protein PENTCL1PPCAC_27192, partial [Pristionchus entomophagus]
SGGLAMKRDETDCSFCNYPNGCKATRCSKNETKSSVSRKEVTSDPKNTSAPFFKVDSCFEIASIGKIPVIRGDPNLMPDKVKDFVVEQITVLRPASIVICTGTVFEEEYIKDLLTKEGRLQRLHKYDSVYTAHADPGDHVTLEGRIFVDQDFCHKYSAEIECDGAHHNLGIPSVRKRARDELYSNLVNSMRGRTMFVIPFSAGPIGGRYSVNAVQLTDCPYTVLTTRMMSRVSSAVWDSIGSGDFIRCVHSVGAPRPVLSPSLYMWPSNSPQAFVLMNMKSKKIFSYGSAHFANAICRGSMCLRVGSVVGREMGWQAESAAIIAISDPSGHEIFACVQGSLGSGKNTIAMLQSTLPGWKVRPVSSTFAWLRWHTDGKLYAMSPENGFCLQWSYRENMKDKQPIEAAAIRKRSILLNVSENAAGDLHWVGRDDIPHHDEASSPVSPSIAHLPRAKSFAVVSASDIETLHPQWDSPMGVPISAYIFLTNRATTVPVLQESPTWKEGLALAMSMRTIKGTGIDHEKLIYNPLGMSTYYAFGLNDYLRQWFDMEKEGRTMPKIFQMNLFRRPPTCSSTPSSLSPATSLSTSSTSLDVKSDKSSIFDLAITPQSEPKQAPKNFKTVWPGFGDNIRLLAWIHGRVMKKESAIGKPFPLGTVVPTSVNVEGLSDVDWEGCIEYDGKGWKNELKEGIKKMKTLSLYEAEQKFLLSFLEKTRGIVKESLGENKEQSSEPVKEEKSGGTQANDGIQAKSTPEPKPELKKREAVPKEEPKPELKEDSKPDPKSVPKVEPVTMTKEEPKGEVKPEVKKEGKVEMKGEEQKEEGKEEQKNGSKEESKEDGKEGEHKDGSREESREEKTQPDSHKEEEKKE